MENRPLDGLKVLQVLIEKMEQKQEENPEYLIRNIELISKIIHILDDFKEEMVKKLPVS